MLCVFHLLNLHFTEVVLIYMIFLNKRIKLERVNLVLDQLKLCASHKGGKQKVVKQMGQLPVTTLQMNFQLLGNKKYMGFIHELLCSRVHKEDMKLLKAQPHR